MLLFALLIVSPPSVSAVVAPYNVAPSAKISLTFDDGLLDALTQAAPILASNGLPATSFVISNCVGMATIPNSCPADSGMSYMTWEQIAQLRDTYGWEIGGHSAAHPMLATDNLTDAQLTQEIAGGKQAMVDHGISPTSFATPYGDYDNRVLAEIAKSYASHRGFWDVDPNVWPYNNHIINNMQVQAGVSVASVQARIDQAVTNKEWLVLTFHGIEPTPSSDPEDYQYSAADLSTIAAYIKSKQDAGLLKAVKMQDGPITSTTNLLSGGSLAGGLSGGWATDVPANVTADSGNHGSYPEPLHSVLATAGSGSASHLFSPNVSVQHAKTYMLQSFLNVFARTSGEIGYYIDEHNTNGDWISGQWKGSKTALTVGDQIFTYVPTSAQVASARLQIYVTAGSGIQAYVDNFRWFALETVESPPPPPVQNALPNSNFDNGVSSGWTTNSTTAFSADNTNHGAPESPTNAIKLLAGSGNASLFAPLVDVDPALTYDVSAYLNIQTLTSNELAFYVDEYDVNGSWVSGQYKTAKRNTGIQVISFGYTPTGGVVKKAGLQVILVGNSGISGYLDEVKFMVPAGSPPPDDNLLANGAFDNGVANGWTTDSPGTITADNTGQGSPANPANAVKLLSTTQNRHLFSPLVVIGVGDSYNLSGYLDLRQITSGEVGFYIDEYDIAGSWISGKYITGISVISAGNFGFAYLPSSSSVARANLQVIVMANSGIEAYIDNVGWRKQQ